MYSPTPKNPQIDEFLKSNGMDRVKSIKNSQCSFCKQPIGEFKDQLSQKEYTISGMCQECQDSTFG